MVFSFVGVAVPEMADWLLSSFSVMVEVEGDRENVLVRGPRWVSLSSEMTTPSVMSPTSDPRRPGGLRSDSASWKAKRRGAKGRGFCILLVSFHDMAANERDLGRAEVNVVLQNQGKGFQKKGMGWPTVGARKGETSPAAKCRSECCSGGIAAQVASGRVPG